LEYLIPIAYVSRFKRSKQVKAKGKGFSIMELKKAGLSVEIARKHGLRIDSRRKSAHQENIEKLKKLINKLSKKKEEIQINTQKRRVKDKNKKTEKSRGNESS
jgi:large subunit ribosomal protein L13e